MALGAGRLEAGGPAAGAAHCPAACGLCPPAGLTGACCHGNVSCEVALAAGGEGIRVTE